MDMRTFHIGDLAYVPARRQNYAYIARLLPAYVANCRSDGDASHSIFINLLSYESDLLSDSNRLIDQAHILQNIYATVHEDLIQGSMFAHQAHICAVAAPGTGAWLHAHPSPIRDLVVPDIAFSDVVNLRLGMPVFSEGKGCNYCGQLLDPLEYHILTCIRQGNKYGIHNSLRDIIH